MELHKKAKRDYLEMNGELCDCCNKPINYRNNSKKPVTFTNVSQGIRKLFCSKSCKILYIQEIKMGKKSKANF